MRGKRARRQVDPRVAGALATAVALLFVWGVAFGLQRGSASALKSLTYVRSELEVPRRHLAAALDANARGQTLLQQAASATGDERNARLAESIAAAEAGAEAWTEYLASAVGLVGEATLAETYERDYDAGKDIAADVLVPIIQSAQPEALPEVQIAAAERNRANLDALVDLYERASAAELDLFAERVERARDDVSVGAAVATVVVTLAGMVGLRIARRIVTDRRARAAAAEVAAVEAQLMRALDLAEDEEGAFRVAADAIRRNVAHEAIAIVVSEGPTGQLTPVVGAPVCGVTGVDRCPALRVGAALRFPDSTALDACPVLAASAGSACSATCMPVSVAGSDAALVQVVGPVGAPPDASDLLHHIVRRIGERVTLVRAISGLQVQASRDPLTGLLNRRSFEAAAALLARENIDHAIAFADLDHFKLVNDVHGHDAGDRALRGFARTLRHALRPDDIACRWGGEEFVVALPGCTEGQAVEVMERLRDRLVIDAGRGATPSVTVSCGVAEAAVDEGLDETVARADAALLEAKATGRDRVVAWSALDGTRSDLQRRDDLHPDPADPR